MQLQSVAPLISRGTAPQQPVEWAHSPKMAKRILTNFEIFIKFANVKTESHEFSSYAT